MPRGKTKTKKSSKSKKKKETPTLSFQEKLAKKRQAKEARKKFTVSLSLALLLAVVIGVPLGLAVDDKIGIALGGGLAGTILSYQYPRASLWFFLIYMPFSGTITYSIGGGNLLFHLAKDVFYFPALIALLQECKRKKQPILVAKKLLPSLLILMGFSMMTLFIVNGYLQFSEEESKYPFLQGVLGVKILLGYIPLIFCAYYLIEDKKKLLFIGRLFVVLAIICCLLGLVQYWMLDSGICVGSREATGQNLFKAHLDARCFVGGSVLFSPSQGQVRLPGTFASPWHWGWFLVANSALTFTTAFSDSSRLWRFVGAIGMGLVGLNTVICGQRLALALVPVVIGILLFLTGQIANLKKFIPIAMGVALIITVAAVNNPVILEQRINSLVGRWQASPPTAFMKQQIDWAMENQKVLGRGLGRGTNSTRIFGQAALVETFHAKLIYELGLMGTFAFMGFISHLTILSYQLYCSVRDKILRSFGSCFLVFMLIIGYFPYWYPLDTDPVSVYYWLLAGMMFKLPSIDKQEREKLAEVENLESDKKKNKGRKKAKGKYKVA